MITHIKQALITLITLITLTTLTHAQVSQETSAQKTTLPAEYTLTSADGRLMAGTVVSKSSTGIKFRRTADGKEFNIPLDKLSAEDRSWVESAKMAALAKALVLSLNFEQAPSVIAYMKSIGIETTVVQIANLPGNKQVFIIDGTNHPDEIPAATLKTYDIVWFGTGCRNENIRGIVEKCNDNGQIIVARESVRAMSKRGLSKERDNPSLIKTPYVKTDENFVFYLGHDRTKPTDDSSRFDLDMHQKVARAALDLATKRKTEKQPNNP